MNFEINNFDKILILAVHPDDIAMACGGFICKYGKQTDVICISNKNSDINYSEDFIKIINKTDINKVYIENNIADTNINLEENIQIQNNLSDFDMKEYDIILIPNKDDGSPERKYLSETLLKTLLNQQGFKDSLQILRYEVWNPLKEANYYIDISDLVQKKKELILSYKANDATFADRILNLNKFRTFTSYLNGSASYVEAYFADNLDAYLERPDIINDKTDAEYNNPLIKNFLIEQDAQRKIDLLAQKYYNKKIIIFGAGEFTRCVFKNYDLSKLNIVAITDKRFEENRTHEFYGLKCISPNEIKNINADIILISTNDFVKSYDILTNTILKDYDIEIAPLIKTELNSAIKGENGEKFCAHPFHALSIVPSGHCITCCPAYIKNYTIGNIFNNDFKSIWNGRRAKYLRNALINNDYTTCDLKTCIHIELKNKNELSQYYDNKGDIKMPDTIFMGWDYDCNVACITCRNKLIKNNESTLKELKAIEQSVLDACKDAKYFYASGNGDPFGSAYARDIIKKVVAINPSIKFLIHTNGILCNKESCDELNITDKIQTITFSIHSACKETYDKIVRYGNFDRVIKNLEWISTLKKEGKIENIYMVFVVHKLNYKDMPDFVRMAEKYNAIASFRYYRQWANNTEYNYDDMAVFEPKHPEYKQFVDILKDNIFDSPNCTLDPSLQDIRKKR